MYIESVVDEVQEDFASYRQQRYTPIVTTICPITLLNMVITLKFRQSDGISVLLHSLAMNFTRVFSQKLSTLF